MRIRRYIVVALLTAAVALLFRALMPRPEASSPIPPSQPENSMTISTNEVIHSPTYLEAPPKPGGGAGTTNNLTLSSTNQPAPAAVITEPATNPPEGDTNLAGPAVVSGQPAKPPWTPPPANPPPVDLGTSSPPVVVPPSNSRPYTPPSP